MASSISQTIITKSTIFIYQKPLQTLHPKNKKVNIFETENVDLLLHSIPYSTRLTWIE